MVAGRLVRSGAHTLLVDGVLWLGLALHAWSSHVSTVCLVYLPVARPKPLLFGHCKPPALQNAIGQCQVAPSTL